MIPNPVKPFYRFCIIEVINFKILINAALIGGSINWFGTGDVFATPMGFVIPFLVQIFSRASVGYKNRYQALLSMLPLEREDPAFIMDHSGNVVLSGGKSKEFFAEHQITNISQFLGKRAVGEIIAQFESESKQKKLEYYVAKNQKWYEVAVKQVKYSKGGDAILVWLEDTSAIKRLHERILSISSYSDQVVRQLEDFTQKSDIYQKLAPFILGMGYQVTFIAVENQEHLWVGQASRSDQGQLIHSDFITLPHDSNAPILLSRKQRRLVEAHNIGYDNQEEFEKEYPFDQRIKDFIGQPIHSFLNFHEGECSIIAFNKSNPESVEDELFLHSLVSTSKSLLFLANLAIRNEEQFLQKVTGLCSAAEFSDEITGKHILRVNKYSELIAQYLGLNKKFVHCISQVAALHDIGKVAIPELIKFTGKYSDDQREQMQMHTIYGAQVIGNMIAFSSDRDEKLEMAYNIALHHHQYWNGTGYPKIKSPVGEVLATSKDFHFYQSMAPLQGAEIPIEALITGLADSYDALRSPRQYKEEFTHEKTVAILSLDDRTGVTGADRFGPQVWSAFEQLAPKMAEIYKEMYS
ncbi:MAG: HD domain-containing protein [SAR324 cluster bacterium]|nr:HD domain-containing protein [SAR324 cluster bacterium]